MGDGGRHRSIFIGKAETKSVTDAPLQYLCQRQRCILIDGWISPNELKATNPGHAIVTGLQGGFLRECRGELERRATDLSHVSHRPPVRLGLMYGIVHA